MDVRKCELRHTVWLLIALIWFPQAQAQVQVQLVASRDTSLFEEETSFANGGGDYLFTGRILTAPRRRALIGFDLTSIPAGSTVMAVSLDLEMSRTISGALNVSLNRLNADWGEGSADAPGQEGMGIMAGIGDATWSHRQFNTTPWASPGGDFNATASATTSVVGPGSYQWTSPQMIADVQQWVDAPAGNFGWALIGNEAAGNGTAKRFNTRENASPASVPTLTVTFMPVAGPAASIGIPTLSTWALGLLFLGLFFVGARRLKPRG